MSSKPLPKNFLTEPDEIKAWLKEQDITVYSLIPDTRYGWSVDVQQDVVINLKQAYESVQSLPVKFNRVKGKFHCSNNKLLTLEGAPEYVDGTFTCDNNELTSLEFGPQQVTRYYFCSNNMLTSLKGACKEVGRDFDCSSNNLSTLEFCPEIIGGDFYCGHNKLTTLAFMPKVIKDDLYIQNNPALGLKDWAYNLEEIMPIHIIAREKLDLTLHLPLGPISITHKI